MARDAIGQVNRVLMHPEIDIVSRLNKIAHEAWVAIVFCSFQSVRVSAGVCLRRLRKDGLVLEYGGKIADILPADRVEIKELLADAQIQHVPSDVARALADGISEVFM